METITLEPITEISLPGLFYLYLVYSLFGFAVALPISAVLRVLKIKFPRRDLKLSHILVGVPVEEGLFRGLPLMLLGGNGLVLCHFLWALLHINLVAVAFACVSGLLELRLWLGGLWGIAVFIHLFHDLLIYSVVKTFRLTRARQEDGTQARMGKW